MNLKHLCTTVIVALGISVTPPAQKAINTVKEEVTKILKTEGEKMSEVRALVQTTEADEGKSRDYYSTRTDISLTPEERESLVLGHARLSVLKEQMEVGKISTQDFLTILKTNEKIITDENTKLKIATNFGRDIGFLSCVGNDLQLRTESYSPDKILRNFSTEIKMEGGELTVSFSGTEFETKAYENKEQISASTDVVSIGPAMYTISIGLVLAK